MSKKSGLNPLGAGKHTGKNVLHTTQTAHAARVKRAVAGDKSAHAALIKEAAMGGGRDRYVTPITDADESQES